MIPLDRLPSFYPLRMPYDSTSPLLSCYVPTRKEAHKVSRVVHRLAFVGREKGKDASGNQVQGMLPIRPLDSPKAKETTPGRIGDTSYRCGHCEILGHTKKICPDLHPEYWA